MADGNIDVYSNSMYKWTQSNTDEILNAGVPYVKMIEYENKTDILLQNILYLYKNTYTPNSELTSDQLNGKATSFKDLYKGTYNIVPTKRIIKLPYLGKSPFHLETTYRQIDPNNTEYSGTLGAQAATMIAGLVNTWNKGIGSHWTSLIDAFNPHKRDLRWDMLNKETKNAGTTLSKQAPKGYESSNYGQFSTTFNLINEDNDHIQSHYHFIRLMLDALVPSYLDPMRLQVPYVYEIIIPSVLHIPLGFISSFDAKPLGSAKMVGNVYAPEAWQVTMAFNNLFPISYQVLSLMNGDKVGSEKETADAFAEGGSVDNSGVVSPATRGQLQKFRQDMASYQTVGGVLPDGTTEETNYQKIGD